VESGDDLFPGFIPSRYLFIWRHGRGTEVGRSWWRVGGERASSRTLARHGEAAPPDARDGEAPPRKMPWVGSVRPLGMCFQTPSQFDRGYIPHGGPAGEGGGTPMDGLASAWTSGPDAGACSYFPAPFHAPTWDPCRPERRQHRKEP